MANIRVDVTHLEDAIYKLMDEYKDVVAEASREGVDSACKELVKDLKAASPRGTGQLAKGWKAKKGRYRAVAWVANTRVTKDKSSDRIPVTNILEYSTAHGHPFIKRTFEQNADKLARIIMGRIEKDA